MKRKSLLILTVLLLLASSLLFAAGAKEKVVATLIDDMEYSYEKLVELAQAEGELVVFDTSSKIVPIGAAFQEKYGITVRATKMGNPEQIERVMREVDAGNVQTDIIGTSDSVKLVNELIPLGYVTNWVPADLADAIPAELQYPLAYRIGQRVFGYNYDSYESSPVTNIWQLTEADWKSRVFLRDPTTTPSTLSFFVTMTKDENAAILAKAYQDYYGKPIQLTQENAGWEFLVRFFQNDPVVLRSDGDVGDAIGSPGQKNAPIGFYTYAKQRDNDTGLRLATAFDLEPFIGYSSGTFVNIVNGSPHPNAARLFVRYLLTEEGVGPFLDDLGTYAPNPAVAIHEDDDLDSWEAWRPYMLILDDELTWEREQDVLDLWFIHASL